MKDHALRKHLNFQEFDKNADYYGNRDYVPQSIIARLNNQIIDLNVKYSNLVSDNNDLYSKYNNLKDKFEMLEAKLFETCTYCGVKVPNGETYETGEKKQVSDIDLVLKGYYKEEPHKACDRCLEKMKKNCEAAKTGYANKAKKVK